MIDVNTNYENLQNSLDKAWMTFQEQTAPLRKKLEMLNKSMNHLDVIFAPIIKACKPLRAFEKLGDNQFSFWRPLNGETVDEILNCNNLIQSA